MRKRRQWRETLIMYLQLRRWAKCRHPNKGMQWIVNKYWHVQEGHGWNFRSQETVLWKHGQAHVQRNIKVKGTASPYDGNMVRVSGQRFAYTSRPGRTDVLHLGK